MNGALFVAVVLFTQLTWAQVEYKAQKVSSSKNRVIITGQDVDSILSQDVFKFTDSFGEDCLATVSSLEKSRVILDTSQCSNKSAILKGSKFVNIGAAKSKELQAKSRSGTPGAGPTLDEDWYTLWGFGFSSISYGNSETQDAVDALDSASSVDQVTYNYDLFGFYWPHADKKSMSGFVVNVNADSFDGPGGTLTISQYTYSYSYHRFFGANIGDGWFLRGDVGFSRFLVVIDTGSLDADEDTDMGIGVLAGAGYGWPIGIDTRMLLSLSFSVRNGENDDGSKEDATNTNLNLGFLF